MSQKKIKNYLWYTFFMDPTKKMFKIYEIMCNVFCIIHKILFKSIWQILGLIRIKFEKYRKNRFQFRLKLYLFFFEQTNTIKFHSELQNITTSKKKKKIKNCHWGIICFNKNNLYTHRWTIVMVKNVFYVYKVVVWTKNIIVFVIVKIFKLSYNKNKISIIGVIFGRRYRSDRNKKHALSTW